MTKVEVNGNFHLLKQKGLSPFEMERYCDYRKRWDENPVKKITGRFPIHLDIETTPLCNLRCPFCITTHAKFKGGMMDLGIFKKIIDEGSAKGLSSIKLNWRGEPLLHPQFAEMAAYAKKKGIIDVFMNTNATLLTESKAKDIIASGMDRFIISFEGYEKGLYESNRVGAKFEETLKNIKKFMAMRKSLKRSFPWVRVQTILLEEIKDKVEDYSRFWEDIVDEVACIDMKNEVNRVVVKEGDWACPQLWQRLTIAWDGSIMPCVNDTFCKMKLGKVPEIGIEEAWKSEQLEKMRSIHSKGLAHEIAGCLDCPLRSAQILKQNGGGA